METQTIGLFEAKTRLSELVARVQSGDEVIITRHNKPVAKIVPYESAQPVDLERRRQALASMQAIGAQIEARGGPITQEEIIEWIREGRR